MKTACFHDYAGPGDIVIVSHGPHGFSSAPSLIPGDHVQSAGVAEFCMYYRRLILAELDPQEMWEQLHQLTKGAEPVLLGDKRPPFSMQTFCQRRLIAE